MDLTWIAYSKKPHAVVFNFKDDYMRFGVEDGADFSQIDSGIVSLQWDSNGTGFSHVQRLNEEGIPEDIPIDSFAEIPAINVFQQMFATCLKDREVSPPDEEILMEELRQLRDEKLAKADIVILKAFEAGETAPSAWVEFRKKLRDLPGEIEAGRIPKPTSIKESDDIYLDDYQFKFDHWPAEPAS